MKQSGFTLLELMLVIGLLGILAAVAIPVYQDYTVRAKISEGLGVMTSIKLAVTETHQATGSFPTTNSQAGVNDSITTDYVQGITVTPGGIIRVSFDDSAVGIGSSSNSTILMTPTYNNGSVAWDCTGGDLPDKYRPRQCR